MSIDYLEDLAQAVERGNHVFTCPAANAQEWEFFSDIETLRTKAQRSGAARKQPLRVYRLVTSDSTEAEGFLIVRRILEVGLTGSPRFQCSVVDTRDAAEMMRDVSQGPTPYFGVITEETLKL